MKVSVGIDIGGTNTAIGIVTEEGHVLMSNSIETPKHGDIDQYLDTMAEAIKKLIKQGLAAQGELDILGIGVGAPNANYYSGTIEHAPNLSFKGIIPFVDKLKERFPEYKHICLTNDANAATIGEMIYGGAKGMKNFAMFTLGTGVGSGLVVNGDLVYGHDGFAGECGHTTLVENGRVCGCGGRGHLEAYASAPGMKRTAFELLAEYNAEDSLLATKSFQELTSKDIFDAAEKGDEIALKVFELTGKYLGQAIADTIAHISPEAVFLFGGPTAAGEYIFEPIRKHVEAFVLPIFKGKAKIVMSQLDMGDAAILGASALVYKEAEK